MNDLIYGKDNLDRVVSVEVEESSVKLFRELSDGSVEMVERAFKPYLLFTEQHSPKFQRLEGNQAYRWIYESESLSKHKTILNQSYKDGLKFHVIRDLKEQYLVKSGVTYFKGMQVSDVSVLAFDIETNGLHKDNNSKVLLISNTFRKNGQITRKLFALDDYTSQVEMIRAWCSWVREVNPAIILGHNIYGFDLPYLEHCSQYGLPLGRNGSNVQFSSHVSRKRKDGSQSYDYTNALIYGREIVDTYFVALDYDIARNYESYGLKQMIKQEGLERTGRQHYDASKIAVDWYDENKRKNIKQYAIDDADDSLKLFDLMIPSRFYYTQSVPRSFQQIINSATGSQINSIMVRAYLQMGHSIAKGSEAVEFEGAISFAEPGVHKNVLRFDVASLYPSIMRQYKVYSSEKDPQGLFLKLVEAFTLERLKNKKLAKESGQKYYEDMQNSQKIAINSMYGFLGAPKLNYNFPKGAAQVTYHGRRILTESMDFLKSRGLLIVGGDTDGLAFKKSDSKKFTDEEQAKLLEELNSTMDELIKFENDGQVKRQINVKTKNYILYNPENKNPKKRLIIKGSSLKATTKEKALKRFIDDVINLLLKDKKSQMIYLYMKYAKDITNIKDISDWCTKKTVTKSVLSGSTPAQENVRDALNDEVNEGDKVFMFFKNEEELCLRENFDGTYSKERLLGKLYDTLCVFENVVDVGVFPDYTTARDRALLSDTPIIVVDGPVRSEFKKALAKVLTTHSETLSKLDDNPKPVMPEGFWQIRAK